MILAFEQQIRSRESYFLTLPEICVTLDEISQLQFFIWLKKEEK